MRILATFVHISDLHFGVIDPSTLDARAPRLWAKFSHLDGLLGHSYKSLVRLEQFFDRLRQSENAQVIVTGDLTTVGKSEEFATANEYLGAELQPPKGWYLGLKLTNWRSMAIPGNHDHWPGSALMLGAATAELSANFPNLPFVTDPPIQLPSGHSLRFLWIDTDADVLPFGPDRFFARGSFTSQLTTLAAMLSVPLRDEIRVICLHHSQSKAGFVLGVDGASRRALNDFIVDHEVAVLLCGHVHDPPLVKSFVASHLMRSVSFLEARCGTTTQLSTLPYYWRNIVGRRPARPSRWPNSLLVHRLLEGRGKIYWDTELYLEKPSGFERPTALPQGVLVDRHVTVWPRP